MDCFFFLLAGETVQAEVKWSQPWRKGRARSRKVGTKLLCVVWISVFQRKSYIFKLKSA